MTTPRFSILVPSRNRLSLLKSAAASIVLQGRSDVEIVISDNDSVENYEAFAATVQGPRVVYSRSNRPLSVTDNWNRALDLASGDYILMLGDDDGLTPGVLDRLDQLIATFRRPDCLYLMAFNYAYPDVFPNRPSGYFCTLNNSPLFDKSSEPYWLDRQDGFATVVDAFRFHHSVSFNAQHFVWSRDFIRRAPQPFFQSPYPDYYACFLTMATATRVVVVPRPEIIIGIARQSFGFYFATGAEDEGFAQFQAPDIDVDQLVAGEKAAAALRFPGSRHYRNWLCAVLAAKTALRPCHDLPVDLERYKEIQLYELAFRIGFARSVGSGALRRIGQGLTRSDRGRLSVMTRVFAALRRSGLTSGNHVTHGISRVLQIHAPPTITEHHIGRHATIMDAFEWLVEQSDMPLPGTAAAALRELDPKDLHIEKLSRLLAQKSLEAARLPSFEAEAERRDRYIGQLGEQIGSKTAEISKFGELIDGKDQHIAKLDVLVERRGTEISSLETVVRLKDEHIAGLQEGIKGKDTHIAGLEGGLKGKDAHVAGLDAAIGRLKEENAAISASAEERIAELDGIVERRSAEIGGLEALVSSKDEHIAKLHSSLGLLEADNAAISVSAAKAEQRIAELDGIVERRVAKINGLDADLSRASATIGLRDHLDRRLVGRAVSGTGDLVTIWRAQQVRSAELDDARRSLVASHAAFEQAYVRLNGIRRSWSWKATLPFRYIGRLAGRPSLNRPRRKDPVAMTAEIALIRESGLFDPGFYLTAYPDVTTAGDDPLRHFVGWGWREGRNPNAFFDVGWYLATYTDVGLASTNPLEHYICHGAAEDRDPGPGFATRWYRERYADVAESGIEPLRHFIEHGHREGRTGSPASGWDARSAAEAYAILASGLFQPDFYLATYPEVAAAGADPLVHFVTGGWLEGRNPNPIFDTGWYVRAYGEALIDGVNPLVDYIDNGVSKGRNPAHGFDAQAYLATHPEVAAAGIDPLLHVLTTERPFVTAGPVTAEMLGAEAQLIAQSGLFDGAFYLLAYPDIAVAGLDPVKHFVATGWREGRNPNALFDTRWYLTTYADVAADGMNPLRHFLQSGAAEGRNPGPGFETDWYLETNPDVAAAGLNPLGHYLSSGQLEGRVPRRPVASDRRSEIGKAADRYERAGDLTASTLLRLGPAGMPEVLNFFLPHNPLTAAVDDRLNAVPTVRILLPSVQKRHATGGPNTAYLLGCLLAQKGIRVAFVSTDVAPDDSLEPIKNHLKVLAGFDPDLHAIVIEDASDRNRPYPIGVNDVFLATAWWTAQAASAAMRLTRQQRIYYLIQDYETLFYAASENYAGAESSYELPHLPIINTQLLKSHLVENRVGLFSNSEFAARAIVFDPAVDASKFYPTPRSPGSARRLLFYARPTIARRNLFGLGVAALKAAVDSGLFGDGGWQFLGIGEPFEPVPLGRGYRLEPAPWLDFEQYAEQMREADLLLSLMLSPHPSYPPLEMAACGGVTVTTAFGSKTPQRLADFSPAIIGVRPTIDDLVGGMVKAVGRSTDLQQRTDNAAHLRLPRTWAESLSPAVTSLVAELRSDGIVSKRVELPPPESFVRTGEAFPNASAFLTRRAAERRISFREGSSETLLSIVTPVFDTDYQQLIDAAHSVFAQDTALPFEWLILDNGSKQEGTRRALTQISRDPRVRIERVEAGLGMIAGTRWCLENARNRYILPFDHDDLLFPDAVRTVTAFLEQSGFPALVYSNEDKIENGKHRDAYLKPGWDPVLLVHSCYMSHLAVIDRSVALELDCYGDREVEGSPDWDTFVRFLGAGITPGHLPEVLYSWRMHPNSTAGNFRSKPYIFKAHHRLLESFLERRGRKDHYEVVASPLFDGTPDYRFTRKSTLDRSGDHSSTAVEFVSTLEVGPGPVRERLLAALQGLPDAAGYVHLQAPDCRPTSDLWREEAANLFDLFDDVAVVGGRIHDGTTISEAGFVLGYGRGCDSPDAGRTLKDAGYFVQMWKPHTTGAVSARHCVADVAFLREALPNAPDDLGADMLGPWLGAMVARSGRRVVYSPFLDATGPTSDASNVAISRFNAEFGADASRGLGYGAHLDRSGDHPYLEGEGAARPLMLPYESYVSEFLGQRTDAPGDLAPNAPSITILTTVYERTNTALFIETAEAVRAQSVRPHEWLVLAHGRIAPDLRAALDQLGQGGVLTPLFNDVNLGIHGGLRHCLEQASGDFALSLDADDLLLPQTIESLTLAATRHPEARILYSDEDLLLDGRPRYPFYRPDFDPALLLSHSYVWHAILFHRETGLELDAFTRKEAEYAQDWDLMLRFYMAGFDPVHVPEILYRWRQHASSLSNSGATFAGSLSSIQALLAWVIEAKGSDTLEVASYPLALGSPDFYLRRLPIDPPPVDLVLIICGDKHAGTRAVPDFPFRSVASVPLLRGPGGLAALRDLAAEGEGEIVMLLGGTVTGIDPSGIWQAVKHLEIIDDCAVVTGCIARQDGTVVAGAAVRLPNGELRDTLVGQTILHPGFYSIALKPHGVDAASPDLLIVRRSFLRDALAGSPLTLSLRSFGAWIGITADETGLRIVYEPLLRGLVSDERALCGDDVAGLNRTVAWIAPTSFRRQSIRGQAAFLRGAMLHGS